MKVKDTVRKVEKKKKKETNIKRGAYQHASSSKPYWPKTSPPEHDRLHEQAALRQKIQDTYSRKHATPKLPRAGLDTYSVVLLDFVAVGVPCVV